jgi:hypothetical protein
MRVLTRRFGEAAESARALVELISAPETLELLHDAALDTSDLRAFIEQARAYLPPHS